MKVFFKFKTRQFQCIILTLTLFFVDNALSQVDDYKMRYEQTNAQLKTQEIALVPQKINSFSKENTQHLHINFTDLIKNNTSIYISSNSIFQSDIYYQNRKTSPTIAIQNVDFNSSILSNNFHWIQTMHPLAYESIQINQGYSLSQLESSGCQIALNYAIDPEKKDSFGKRIKAIGGGGNMDYSALFQYTLHNKKTSYIATISGGENFNYSIGETNPGSPNFSWSRIANPYNGHGLGSWTYQRDSLSNKEQQVFISIDNLLNLKVNKSNEWNFYLRLAGSQGNNIGNTIQRGNNYLMSESSTKYNPSILAFIQKVNYSESSPFYTQLNLAINYHHLNQQMNRRYDIHDDIDRQHYEENKTSLQLRAYKDFNARHILFYGSEVSMTFIENNSHLDAIYTSFFDKPIAQFKSYFKFEKRQSADISWFIGAKGGFETIHFHQAPFVQNTISKINPSAEFNISWLRHICESSNYMFNIFLRSNSPRLNEYNPVFQHIFLKPNPNLTNETELLIESHLYRKFEDKLEIHFSPYFRHSWNAILLKDNIGNLNEKKRFGLNEYYTQIYTNQNQLTEGGLQIELKYNLTKKLLIYHQINIHHLWTKLESNLMYHSLPIYGNAGIKYKTKKLFVHTWLHFNLGKKFKDSVRSQYIEYYAKQHSNQKEFLPFYDINLGFQYQFNKNIGAQLNLENLLDQFQLNFLSTLPNAGRRFKLQLIYSL